MATTPAITSQSVMAVSPFPDEQQDLTLTSDHPSNTSQTEQTETLTTPVPILPPLFINSIAEMKDLSAAIASFHKCYEDLQNHLDSIKTAILTKLPSETPHVIPIIPPSSLKSDVSETATKPDVYEISPIPDVSDGTVLQKQGLEQKPLNSELEGLCKTMCSRDIRRYLVTHISNLPKLREEVPKALKLVQNLPKLVLECLGKFYLQGSKAFTRNSPMITAREASIFILECFLLMMGMDTANEKDSWVLSIEKEIKAEADKAALAWRKRMVVEGGLATANQIDARGLLLFVACFGIPDSFKRDDVRDLVVAANAKEIVGVLRKSHVLMNKIPEIVEGMVKHKMEADAVDLVYTFGLEERFNPQNILVSYLQESKESWKKPKGGSHGSAASLNEANKKQLATLKSIRNCLERHKIDPAKLLPGWQINEKITTLEKEITHADRKAGEKSAHKRKASETERSSKKSKTHEPKRTRYNISHGPQHPKPAAGHADSRRNLLKSGPTNHPNNYHASTPVVYGGPGAGLLPESMVPSGYAGVHGGVMVDTGGQVINRGANPYVWYRDSAVNERFDGQSSSLGVGLTSLYRGPTSVEGFAGVPNASSVGVGSLGSDLYQFADSVVERESYLGGVGHCVGGVPSAVPAYHSSYLYQG